MKNKYSKVKKIRSVYKKLLEPAQIGNVKLRNRAVAAPMLEYWARRDGEVTEKHINYYREQAKGGVGLTVVGPASIDDGSSKEAESQVGIYDDRFLIGLRQLTETIHLYGGKACIQIVHAGLERYYGNYPILVPSKEAARRIMAKTYAYMPIDLPIHELTTVDIAEIIEKFAEAALRAKKSGFDMIEFHGAHGYLITNFLSKHTNQRTDRYGGDIKGRIQFGIEVVKRAKEKAGNNFPIGMRVSGTEYISGGITIDDTITFARELEKVGLDFLDMSAGNNETADKQVQPYYLPHAHGYNVWLSARAKKELTVPVIIAGGMTVRIGETVLEKGQADFIAFGRGLLADPYLIKKVEEGRPDDIRQCIMCCDGCVERTLRAGQGMRCTLNVAMSREDQFARIEYGGGDPAPHKKKVFVIGGGPGGMEACRVAALRGHDVTLFEAKSKLGGALLDASIPHFKKDLNRIKSYQSLQLKQLGVKLVLGKEAGLNDILEGGPDAVIVATGSRSIRPVIHGIEKTIVVDALEALRGEREVGNKVIVVGANMIGCELAWLLAENKPEITLVTRNREPVGYNIPFVPMLSYKEEVAKLKVTIVEGFEIQAITDTGITGIKEGKKLDINADSVVVVGDFLPNNDLTESLREIGLKVTPVGDCISFRTIHDAIYEGYIAGYTA